MLDVDLPRVEADVPNHIVCWVETHMHSDLLNHMNQREQTGTRQD